MYYKLEEIWVYCKFMQNLEYLVVFEILITQKLLKCPKDPFVRSALYILYMYILYIYIFIYVYMYIDIYYICIYVWKCMARKNRINYWCKDGMEKSAPRDHLLSSFGKPCDANGDLRDDFIYPTLTRLMYSWCPVLVCDAWLRFILVVGTGV